MREQPSGHFGYIRCSDLPFLYGIEHNFVKRWRLHDDYEIILPDCGNKGMRTISRCAQLPDSPQLDFKTIHLFERLNKPNGNIFEQMRR